MALRPVTRKYTFTTGTAKLTDILGRDPNTWMGSMAIRAGRSNSNDTYWADVEGQVGGYIGPAEAVTFDYGEGQALVSQFTFNGAVGDIIYLTVGLSSVYFKTY